jgi:L-ascorbate metabolism protein UlaG (beta-lactamase superfamily)
VKNLLKRNSKRKSEHYSGLKPKKGWPKRNIQMLKNHVIPGIFRTKVGETREFTDQPLESGQVRLTWIGHSGFLIEIGIRAVIVDPNWANWLGFLKRLREPGLHLHQIPEVDLVMVTHAHHDHMHKKSLKILQSKSGVIVPRGSASLVKKLGFSTVHEMDIWELLNFDELEIIHTPAMHWGARFFHDTHRDYGGYIIRSQGKNIFHCGDSAYFPGFKEIGERYDIDIALMPIGAYDAPSGRNVHMNPEEAIQAFSDLDAKILIPMHYGTFPLGNEPIHEPVIRLLSEAERLSFSDRVMILQEGESMIFS